jgi:hypothetical protein
VAIDQRKEEEAITVNKYDDNNIEDEDGLEDQPDHICVRSYFVLNSFLKY